MDETIAGWSPADLRRFVVNTILTDPGAYPKQAKDNSPGLPTNPGLVDTDVPVWSSTTNSWVAQRALRLPQDFSYIRMQGQPSGFIVDTAFRIYNWSSAVTEYVQDSQGFFNNSGSRLTLNKACRCFIGMSFVGPNAGNYSAGFTPVYNGASIDSIMGGFYYNAAITGVIQNGGQAGWGIASFAGGDYIQIGGYCNSGVPTVVLTLMVLPS